MTEKDISVLLEQLRLLGASAYHVVCFGNKPFDGLVEDFDAEVTTLSPELKYATVETQSLTLHHYRVWLYGLYGANQDKVEIYKRQLQEPNDRLV